MEIIDGHGHIFPPLAEACGFQDVATHRLHLQRAMHLHGNQPVRRLRDHAIVEERHLWDADDPSENGLARDVDFQVGAHGRFSWRRNDERYYVQFLPPSLQDMHAPAEFMVAQMDYAGIAAVVLQNDHIYGNLAEYFADAVRRFPNRFYGLAQVEEAFAGEDRQIAALEHQVTKLGMRGLYINLAGFFRNGYAEYYTAPSYRPFWDTVRALEIPVFWVFWVRSPIGDFSAEMSHFRTWLERYPDIPSVFVHGIPTSLYADSDDRLVFPDDVGSIMDEFPVFSEILYPIMWGGRLSYPFARAHTHIRQVYDRFGPDKLIWGSDMPNVERYCTYRQALTYLLDHCDFLSPMDREKIFRRNILDVLKLDR